MITLVGLYYSMYSGKFRSFEILKTFCVVNQTTLHKEVLLCVES
jgi:hypothetical protein